MTTAVRCYEYLEALGYVDVIPKVGFYVCKPQEVCTNEIFPDFKSKVLRLNTLGLPTFTTPESTVKAPLLSAQLDLKYLPNEMLTNSFSDIFKSINREKYQYGNIEGSDKLRKSLVKHFLQNGLPLSIEEMFITNGCLDAVSMALDIVSNPGDTILITSPCFSGFLQLLALMNRTVIEIPSTIDGIDLKKFKYAIETYNIAACLITASYQNPSGHSLSIEQKKWLARFANRNKFPIIEDDIYAELSHDNVMPLPIKNWDKSGDIIWCSSISKSLSAGIRLGWCSAGKYTEEFIKYRGIRTLGINQPLQEGLANFINLGHYNRHIRRINTLLSTQVKEYIAFLKLNLPKCALITIPKGGLVIWIKIAGLDASLLEALCKEKSIFIMSGNAFSSQNLYGDCFRINFGTPLNKTIKEQILVICEIINGIL